MLMLFLENTDFGRKTWGEVLWKLLGTHFSDSSTGLSQCPWLLQVRMWADKKTFPLSSRPPMAASPLSVLLMCCLLKGSKGIVSASSISPQEELTDLCWNFSNILPPNFLFLSYCITSSFADLNSNFKMRWKFLTILRSHILFLKRILLFKYIWALFYPFC